MTRRPPSEPKRKPDPVPVPLPEPEPTGHSGTMDDRQLEAAQKSRAPAWLGRASAWRSIRFSSALRLALALGLLWAVHGLSAAAAAPARDVADTRQRLERIYEEHGIARQAEEGCGGEPGDKAGPGQEPPLPDWLAYGLLGVLLALMLAPLVYLGFRAYRQAGRTPAEASPGDDGSPGGEPAAPWQVDLGEARALAAQGRLAEALAALHRASLLGLERAGVLELGPATTNWEYVRRLDQERLRSALAAVTEGAERAVLGGRAPSAEEYRALDARVDAALRDEQ